MQGFILQWTNHVFTNVGQRQLSEESLLSQSSQSVMRTDANPVDVRGCNLLEAQDKIKDKFSRSLMNSQKTIYILHGQGTGGVLKTKIQNWLKTECDLVKRWQPADKTDGGGDALTRVE
jgi:DNA-nicking Smr family endonuclease